MPFAIVRNDITKMDVDAIVNTANPKPIIGAGADSAIHQAAGSQLLVARQEIGVIAPGSAAITPGFALPCKYVIHTVGPVWQDGECGEEDVLRSCYQTTLQLAVEHQCESIAFPLISSGNYCFPKPLALQIANQMISNFVLEHDMMVYLVVYDNQSFDLSEKLFTAVESFIDEHYIDEHQQDTAQFYRRNLSEMITFEEIEDTFALSCPSDAPPKRKLDELIFEVEDTFSESLLRLIDAKGYTDPEVYKRANIDRKHFNKIKNNKHYQPTKATALAFAIALRLNLDETRDFIARAGFALSHSSIFDIIVEYFILEGNYDLFELNACLFKFGQQPINV